MIIHPLNKMLITMRSIKQTEIAITNMIKLSLPQKAREDFTSEEWNLFVDYFQELLQLEYSLGKLKHTINNWYKMVD